MARSTSTTSAGSAEEGSVLGEAEVDGEEDDAEVDGEEDDAEVDCEEDDGDVEAGEEEEVEAEVGKMEPEEASADLAAVSSKGVDGGTLEDLLPL